MDESEWKKNERMADFVPNADLWNEEKNTQFLFGLVVFVDLR